MFSKDQSSKQVNDLYKQDQGLNQYYQDRDWEEQDESPIDRYIFKQKNLTDLFDINTTEISAGALNDLIEINLDRILSYELAINELNNHDADLKILFAILICDSYQYIDELGKAFDGTGHEMISGSFNSGKIYRRWLDLNTVIAVNRRKAILSGCEFREEVTQKAYDTILVAHEIPAEIRALISEQKESLEMSYRKIKELRNLQSRKEISISSVNVRVRRSVKSQAPYRLGRVG